MDEVRRLSVPGRYASIPAIVQFVGEAARSAGLDENAAFHCQMAVDEASTNIIEHAYGSEDAGDIHVTCIIETGKCVVEIVDHGKPFNPDSVPEPGIAGCLEELRPGGIGLHLMRQLMDEVRFEFSETENRLVMVKTQQPGSKPEPSLPIPAHSTAEGIWLLTPRGRLDATNTLQLEASLTDLLKQGHCWLLVDMTMVTYIASRGLKTLVSGWRTARDAGGELALCGLTERVYTLFETVGFTQVFGIYETVDEGFAIMSAQLG